MSAMAPIRSAGRPEPDRDPVTAGQPVRAAGVDHVEEGGVGPVQADQRPGERPVQRVLGQRMGHPRPGLDGTARAHLDHLAGVLAGGRVVLGGRHDHRPARPPDPEQPPLTQAGQERPDDRAHRARIRVFEEVTGVQCFALGHPDLPLDCHQTSTRKVEHISLLCANGPPPRRGRAERADAALPWHAMAAPAADAPTSCWSSPTRSASGRGSRPASRLPWRDRLRAEGLEFTNYFTHSSPCSPSRASLFTGRYLAGHGVVDNVIMPEHPSCPPRPRPWARCSTAPATARPTSASGTCPTRPPPTWRPTASPTGTATTATSWGGPAPACTSTRSSPPTPPTGSAATPDAGATGRSATEPWFLTVALVNPHDVMWFPVDQPGYRERHPDDVAAIRSVLESAAWKDDDPLPVFTEPYPEVVDQLPANFDDDLHTKPEAHRQWRWDQQHGLWGYIDPADKRGLAPPPRLLRPPPPAGRPQPRHGARRPRGRGAWDDTVVIFTSDHGDMCGSHGLRSKGPFVYDEIMRVPLYVQGPRA